MSVLVFPKHLRSAMICTRGGREWFKAKGLDWSRFVIEGLDSDVLLATGDPFAVKAVEAAEKDAARGE